MKNKKGLFVLFIIILLLCGVIFYESHSISYKYNNWWIKKHSIKEVKEKYGSFDYGDKDFDNYVNKSNAKTLVAGYFIKKGKVDFENIWLYIEYDANSFKVIRVYEGRPMGG